MIMFTKIEAALF